MLCVRLMQQKLQKSGFEHGQMNIYKNFHKELFSGAVSISFFSLAKIIALPQKQLSAVYGSTILTESNTLIDPSSLFFT